MALAPDVLIRRLVFVRYLYTLALQQSSQSGLAGAVSVLTFHDAVEMLLVLGLQHHDRYVASKLYRFQDYWAELALARVNVTQKGTMESLSRARVGLKHHATPPDRSIIEDARVHVHDFLVENTTVIFDLNFDEVELSSLVTSPEARNHLKNAERQIAAGEYNDAMGEIAYGFYSMLEDHETRTGRSRRGARLAFRLPPSFRMSVFRDEEDPLDRYADDPTDFQRFVSVTERAIHELQDAVRVLSLGLDVGRWNRFMELTPAVVDAGGNMAGYLGQSRRPRDTPPTLDECRFCYDFVIDSALRLQEGA